MIKAVLSGCAGAMGKNVAAAAGSYDTIKIICGYDKEKINADFPVVTDFNDIKIIPDIVIDFSHPSVLNNELSFCIEHHIPLLLATTGYNSEQISEIKKAAKQIPIFFTANMSLGVNLMNALCAKAAPILSDRFDIEIIEKHHNQKVDAPSGTALLLADTINSALECEYSYEFDRHSKRKKRNKKEIGISSVRAGGIVGEHTVLFADENECLEIKHTAFSKSVFATGALNAACWLVLQQPGLYDMKNFLEIL